jgi:hypothetical protein
MKKLFVVLVAIVLVASFASSQTVWGQGKMSVGVGGILALPMGTFGDIAGTGIGGSGTFQYGLSDELLLTAQIGYVAYAEKEVGSFKWKFSQMPILAGVKYSLGGAFLTGQVGIVSTSVDATYSIPYYGTVSGSSSSSDLAFAPGIGYAFGPIEATAKYLIVSTSGDSEGSLVLDIQYVFGL